jgi:molecular chaperone GrpE
MQPQPSSAAPAQIDARLRHLASQLDHLDARLSRLLSASEEEGAQVDALVRHFVRDGDGLGEELASVQASLEENREQLTTLAGSVTKLNRTLFKSNTLTEGQAARIDSALDALREIATRREQAQAARPEDERARIDEARREARRQLAADFLPVLDGIERALSTGGALGEQRRREAPQQKPQRTSQRWAAFWRSLTGAHEEERDQRDAALEGWLRGLELVRDRMLGLLAEERIERIPTDIAFDPRLHVAVRAETRAGAAPGTIMAVHRPGYRHGEQVLRYAEVVVARSEPSHEAHSSPPPSSPRPSSQP